MSREDGNGDSGVSASLDDIIGIESIKLGFFKEVQKTINELKASNIELERKRRDVQDILNGIPDVVAVVSREYKVLSVNSAFYETYGSRDPIGLPCYRVFKGADKPCLPCPLLMAREEGRKVCRQLQIMNIDGENRQIECSAALMPGTGDAPGKVLLLHRDVTVEKQYQAKYFQAERMATVGVLAEGVAHEINNPLTSIRGFAEALSGHLGRLGACLKDGEQCNDLLETFEEYLDIVLQECNRCSEIVQNLLSFGHRDVRSMTIVNINNIIVNCLKLLQPRLASLPSGVIGLSLSEEEPCLMGHPGELMQVALNLIVNALYEVRDTGGTIRITTSVTGSMIQLRVSDTGKGFEPEDAEKLFQPFFTTKPAGQGIGIGLSTCYNIIMKHGGEITATSEPGKGAVFEVILPRLEE
ncbi:ATP-binding protein [Pseudodesulfovibrio thermohalotolerans]|uniref:two-component system sensor histidine kinase NtrB n=1 Tax=Pseudodesulfovibrio thermohalotolerans TaxID=2880651 RepID=UPI00244139B1|nr:ATP-binding protein [Pseudodesulfovibrio thermohalotolerans]WFS62645.1 ATP-binding protein [Pseudodesulfovibrio thermohalotolerans]